MPTTETPTSAPRLALRLALLCGMLHAGVTVYWLSGGTALLETVGTWALTQRDSDPAGAELVLSITAVVKLAAAVIPFLALTSRIPWPRLWRAVSWPGAALLVVYGGVNTLGAWLQIAGVWPMPDPAGTVGHAVLWDPLFLAWGAALLVALHRTATSSVSPEGRYGRTPSPARAR